MFKILFAPTNILAVTLYICAENHAGFHVMCPFFILLPIGDFRVVSCVEVDGANLTRAPKLTAMLYQKELHAYRYSFFTLTLFDATFICFVVLTATKSRIIDTRKSVKEQDQDARKCNKLN
jgi:hypothetical protein